ncbi:MAG TPA: transglycosylase SLT domain-containing protein [Smithella sp.]|jgi:membrane-bound lytic murein transglycosylase D|nr:transglycosylase SLT domain-containing protein [Smithella sp.]OQC54013.1 MAG: Membrane-bound lytic murein transglycosylase D precursor [Deltaproteobacteria bacterium ADurb.Bin022]HNQ65154.1 transglycosylase SLT domain-containing protein [Smithella sp.]HOE31872.1 transglycosylase SLT domain-containing protein [Smithella sp.]HOG10592.1 transglycosylase SLT domain-containing protein [Smithella sp.]
MTGLTRNRLIGLIALICLFIVPLIGYAENSIDKKSPESSGDITKQKIDQKIKLAALNNDDESSLFDFPQENDPLADVQEDDEKQDMMENALELLGEADKLWKNGDIEETLDTLDEAYSLILNANGDSAIAQEKDDLRLLISQRILAVYSSKRDVLQGKNGEIPLLMNGDVQKEITSFQTVERDSFLAAYERSGMYRSEIVKELKRSGIPEEFFWLPLVESLFKINAYSSARALGLWQFIPSTGYKFGLNRDEWVDERMDVQKSTKAAIAYLKELHGMFGDWLTALAAYNCGEGRVLRVISRQRLNYLDSFWDLYRQLPNETARYVPRFLATLHIVNNPQKYGFDLSHTARPIEFETVRVNRIMKFNDIAERIDTTEDILCLLNPELRHKMTPDREYDLKVPGGMLDKFSFVYHEIPSSEKPSIASVQTYVKASDRTRRTYIKHRVKRGETLYSISRKYKVSISSIRSLNKLSPKKKLIQGRRLLIPVASAKRHAKGLTVKKKFKKK